MVLEKTLENPLEGLMLKLKLQYFGYLMQRADSFENTLSLSELWAQGLMDREAGRAAIHGVSESWTRLSD